jgi:UDP-N-acetylglucosamine 2-epimerase (non-hydrolysing)
MILICFGTRPEFLKVKPLFKEFDKQKIPYKTVFTGQHVDLIKETSVDYRLTIKDSKNRLNSVFTSVMLELEPIFQKENPKWVLVQGDTTSACAFALSSYHHRIKIIHLEAGLRTYDRENPFPEEANRQIISKIADLHLCPTESNAFNLKEEKTIGDIRVVGNTALDNLSKLKTEIGDTVLVTLHRRENHENIEHWFTEIEKLANENPILRFILPIHPNPNVQKWRHLLKTVEVISPLEHKELIDVMCTSALIITDSGGIQEEASFLKKKTIICRKTTERPESLGQSGILCGEPQDLENIFYSCIEDLEVKGECPYGDGKSSKKIAKILQSY